jgi:hypothetical protein
LPYIPPSRTASIPNQKAITKRLPDEEKPQDKFYHNALKSQITQKSHDSSVERRSKLSTEKSRESIHAPRSTEIPTITRKGTLQIKYVNPGPQRENDHTRVSLEPQHTGYSFGQALRDSPSKGHPQKVSSIFGDVMVKKNYKMFRHRGREKREARFSSQSPRSGQQKNLLTRSKSPESPLQNLRRCHWSQTS